MVKPEDSRLRAVLKSASYIVSHETMLFFIAWVFTGDAFKAVTITLFGSLAEFAMYYLHERAWSKIKVSKKVEKR